MEALEARQLAMDSDPRVTGTREGDTANTIDQVKIFLVLPLFFCSLFLPRSFTSSCFCPYSDFCSCSRPYCMI
jgi:hypothetical protein